MTVAPPRGSRTDPGGVTGHPHIQEERCMAEKMESLHDLFVKELSDLHSAENQIMKALPKMQRAASSPQLQDAFEHHLEETKEQFSRLEQVFERLGEKPGKKKCKGIEGIIEEGAEVLGMKGDAATRDAALIASAQKVEHYEIASYGTVATYARMLGDMEAARSLGQILDEEKETDEKLTQLAKRQVNVEAREGSAR
jgi:ferritin-like metal-binding protein YciE